MLVEIDRCGLKLFHRWLACLYPGGISAINRGSMLETVGFKIFQGPNRTKMADDTMDEIPFGFIERREHRLISGLIRHIVVFRVRQMAFGVISRRPNAKN